MSAHENSSSKTHPSRAFTIWTGERPVTSPTSGGATGPSAAPLMGPPSRAFTLWTAAVNTAPLIVAGPPSRAFTIWTETKKPAPAISPAPTGAVAQPQSPIPARQSSFAGSLVGLAAAAVVAVVFGILAGDFRDGLKDLKRSNADLRKELTDIKKENEKQQDAIKAATADLAKAEKSLIALIGREKADALAKIANADKVVADQIAQLTADSTALNKRLADTSQALTAQVTELNAGKAALQQQKATEKARVDGLLTTVKTLGDGLAAEKTASATQLAAEKARIDGLLANTKALDEKLKAEKAALQDQLEGVGANLQTTRASFEKVIQALTGLGGAATPNNQTAAP